MASRGIDLYTLITLTLIPVILTSFLVLILAVSGKSLGIRRKYAQFLLKIFEYGQKIIEHHENPHRDQFGQNRIEKYEKKKFLQEMENEDDSEDEDCQSDHNHIDECAKQVIRRDIAISAIDGIRIPSKRPDYDLTDLKKEFHVSDIMYFAKCGAESIIEDDVTKCFTSEELRTWNFLTRTTYGHQYVSVRLTILWCLGCVFRYCFLLPYRIVLVCLGLFWLIFSTAVLGYLPQSQFKRKLNRYVTIMSHRILSRACSAIVTYHNRENKAENGICVANHTSPIDVIILSCDNCYAMVGQAHGGFLGLFQRALSRSAAHIWFERSEGKDRYLVAKRLREHVEDKTKLPILIFPEGTCINNTSVMMFKKGSFEISSTIYPVAIKYDPRFGDAFWNSSKMGMVHHIYDIFTSWALVAEVWYLPPMTKQDDEDAVQFANRVKKEIAKKGGLVDLEWDGQLKRMRAKDSGKLKPQEDFSKILKIE